MNNVYIIGDLHFGALTAFPNGLEMQVRQFTKLVDYCHKKKALNIVLTGDLFDVPHPPQEVVLALMKIISRGVYRDIDWHIYPGNHDLEGTISSLSLFKAISEGAIGGGVLENVYVYDKPRRGHGSRGDLPFYFLPYPHSRCDEKDVVVFAHTAFKGVRWDNGRLETNGEPFDSKRAKSLNQLWISGHLHTEQQYKRLHYIGTIGDTKYRRCRDHYIGFIEWDDRKTSQAWTDASLQYIQIDPDWRMISLDITDSDSETIAIDIMDISNGNTRLRAVVKEPYTYNMVSQKLKDNPHVKVETDLKAPKNLLKKAHDNTSQTSVGSNREWIMRNLPAKLTKNPFMRRITFGLIDKAEHVE
jgi:DNA repair exonuclease SbcCD nuclease subunit